MSHDNQSNELTFIFDFGGVLIDWNPRYLYQKIIVNDEAKLNYFLDVVCSPEWNSRVDAGYPISEAVEKRVRQYPEFESYIRTFFVRWEEMIKGEIIGTVKILSALHQSGYPLCALSNWSCETYPRVENRFEFLQWFDEIIISGCYKLAKPDPTIFELLLNRIHRSADQCLLVDDSVQNIQAADQMGFQTIHFSSPQNLNKELEQRKILPIV